jgi:outer membrane lipoprotein-sorting protein
MASSLLTLLLLLFTESFMIMQLSHYPAAIAQAAERVNEIDSQLLAVQQVIHRLEGNAERVAAFEPELKNDSQRKARRFEVLLIDQEYQKAVDTSMRLTSEKANALAHLEYLRNQFSVAKLEARLAIAQQLTDFESRELVGF